MPPIDLSALTLVQVLTLAVVLAAFDLAAAVVSALVSGTFDASRLPDFLVTHVLSRIFPIGALALLGSGGPAIGLPLIPPLFALAIAGLAAYLVETVASISASLPKALPAPVQTGPRTPTPDDPAPNAPATPTPDGS
jgi:hypothetical protein